MKGISNKVLIDPSLLVAENSIYRTLQAVKTFTYLESQFEFYYPQSLHELIHKPEWYEKRWAPKYFLGNAYPSAPAEILRFLEDTKEVVSSFQVKAEQREKHRPFYEVLQAKVELLLETPVEDKDIFDETKGIFPKHGEHFDKDIMNILFEEWVFLNESSWIVSRIKQPFTKFMAAGGVSLQFGKRATDLLIRKTLKKTDDELLSKVDRLRAFGKWIAVGGPSVAGIIADPLVSSITSIPAGFFLLFDPDTQVTNTGLP